MYQTTTLPSGGGNQFFRALNNFISLTNARADSLEEADVVLFNSHHFLRQAADAKRRFPDKIFVHRIDGPMRLYNRKFDNRDHAVNMAAELISDGTIFQSKWSRDANCRLAFYRNKYEIVIHNAADPNIFNRNMENTFSGDRVIRLVATSWSANWKKGFKVYKWLDDHLNFNRYEMVFIGNSPIKFNNIKHIPPLKSEELAQELKNSDIFITASQKDPCSNSLIEALHCGLPAVVLQDGGHIEILGRAGETFKRAEEIPDLLEKITARYADYQANISLPPIEKAAGQYFDFMHKIHESAKKGLYKPKRFSRAGWVRILAKLNAWRLIGKLTVVKDIMRTRIDKSRLAEIDLLSKLRQQWR